MLFCFIWNLCSVGIQVHISSYYNDFQSCQRPFSISISFESILNQKSNAEWKNSSNKQHTNKQINRPNLIINKKWHLKIRKNLNKMLSRPIAIWSVFFFGLVLILLLFLFVSVREGANTYFSLPLPKVIVFVEAYVKTVLATVC